jgi:hypothetical protein
VAHTCQDFIHPGSATSGHIRARQARDFVESRRLALHAGKHCELRDDLSDQSGSDGDVCVTRNRRV